MDCQFFWWPLWFQHFHQIKLTSIIKPIGLEVALNTINQEFSETMHYTVSKYLIDMNYKLRNPYNFIDICSLFSPLCWDVTEEGYWGSWHSELNNSISIWISTLKDFNCNVQTSLGDSWIKFFVVMFCSVMIPYNICLEYDYFFYDVLFSCQSWKRIGKLSSSDCESVYYIQTLRWIELYLFSVMSKYDNRIEKLMFNEDKKWVQ